MNTKSCSIQIGKNGLTEGTFVLLENAFKTREDVRVCLLKSAGHDKEKIKEVAEKILEKLGKKYTYKSLGFTIFLKKWRKARR
ncbi:MAG: YhbY family RNA-binding protein [Candidatus Pacearchaeota archaeon]|nr:YhbY family RNA-binding protein [Candidatus Pacearchaeota archaeon]